jgi:hypothetical protein
VTRRRRSGSRPQAAAPTPVLRKWPWKRILGFGATAVLIVWPVVQFIGWSEIKSWVVPVPPESFVVVVPDLQPTKFTLLDFELRTDDDEVRDLWTLCHFHCLSAGKETAPLRDVFSERSEPYKVIPAHGSMKFTCEPPIQTIVETPDMQLVLSVIAEFSVPGRSGRYHTVQRFEWERPPNRAGLFVPKHTHDGPVDGPHDVPPAPACRAFQ